MTSSSNKQQQEIASNVCTVCMWSEGDREGGRELRDRYTVVMCPVGARSKGGPV